MMDPGHLSDLQLDRIRKTDDETARDPGSLRHLSTCDTCRRRLQQFDAFAAEARPELARVLEQAEQKARQEKRRTGLAWLPGIVTAAVVGAAILAICLWPSPAPREEDGVRVKGGPSLQVLDEKAQEITKQTLLVGQKVRVRFHGTPPPVFLVLRDTDGSRRIIWPQPGEARPAGNEVVELDLSVGDPPGRLFLVAFFGPGFSDEAQAIRISAALEDISARNQPSPPLPQDTKAIFRQFEVLQGDSTGEENP